MANQQSNKELVKAGHAFAAAMSMDTPIIVIAKMVTELATRLDVMSARCTVIAAENSHLWPKAASELSNAWLLHKTMMGAQAALYCLQKGEVHAAKEWLEGTTDNCELEIPDESGLNDLDTWFTGHMKGNITHNEALAIIRQDLPTTETILNGLRAEGVEMLANAIGSPYAESDGQDYEAGFNSAIEVVKTSTSPKLAKQLRADTAKDGE